MSPRHIRSLLALTALLLAASLLLAGPAQAAEAASSTPAVLGDTASWALLAGVLLPLLTSVVQQPKWTKRVRTIVAVVVSVVAAVVTLLANGSFNDGPQTVLTIVALVVATSATMYKTVYVPLGIAPAIENATSKNPPYAPDHSDESPAEAGMKDPRQHP